MTRPQHAAQGKAKGALEALKGHSPVHELASRDGVHPAQITRWKPPLEDGVDAICSRGQPTRVRAEEALRARLSPEIGPLKVELDWLQRQVSPRCSHGGDA